MTPILPVSCDRAVVIGDVHGRRDLLDRLLARLPDVPIFTLGDVCDRGADTRGVIDMLIERGARGVRGNHEDWLLAWVHGEGFDRSVLRPFFGGEATLLSYGVVGRSTREVEAERWRVPRAHVAWLESLAVAVDLDVAGTRYWMLHAGVPAHRSFEGLSIEQVVPWLVDKHPLDLRWTTTQPDAMPPVDRPVIMGHLPQRDPTDDGSVIAIDTGSGTLPGGRLTALLLPERRFMMVG